MTEVRRVVVTGLGAVSTLGHTAADNWTAARAGQSGIKSYTLDPGKHGPAAAQTLPLARVMPGYESAVEDFLGRKECAGLDPFAALALCASFDALQDSGLLGQSAELRQAAVVLGHGFGGLDTLERAYERYYGDKQARLHPTTVPRVMVSAGVSAVAMAFGVTGPVFATSSACASAAHAIAQSASLIAAGLADVAITGGSEAIETPGCMRGWEGIRALAAQTCRPFSIGRDGLVMGEGGAALVLEEYQHARARKAPIYAELTGAGMTSDAFHLTQPSLDGPSSAMAKACKDLITRGDESPILISSHGTGTPLNDRNEAAAIHKVFGSNAKRHPVIATKSAHGHLIGGTAALQAVLGLQALGERIAPPILNYVGPDPECDLNLVTQEARRVDCAHLLVNAFAFGGLNVALRFSAHV